MNDCAFVPLFTFLCGCSTLAPCKNAGECPPSQSSDVDGGAHPIVHPPVAPSASLLRDGDNLVLATCSVETGIVISRSRLGTDWTTVSTPIGPGAESPVLGWMLDGQLLLAFARADIAGDGRALPDSSSIYVTSSHDGGRSFGAAKKMDLTPLSHGVPHGRMITRPDGTLVLPAVTWYSASTPLPAEQQGRFASVLLSPGKSANEVWYPPFSIARGYREPVVAALAGNHLVALVRDDGGAVMVSTSYDGRTWTLPAWLASADPRAADLLDLPDGRLLLTFAASCGAARTSMTALFSEDGTGFGLPRRLLIGAAPTAAGFGAVSSTTADGHYITLGTTAAGSVLYRESDLKEVRCAEIRAGKQLFLDDELVGAATGVEFHLHPPQKTGEVLIRADSPWESFITGDGPSVLVEGNKVRLYYEAYDLEYSIRGDFGARTCYAESVDGGPFVKPNLGLVTYHGSLDNNIIYPTNPDWAHYGDSVFFDPSAPPAARYKMFAGGDGGLRGALSPDGLRFTRIEGWTIPLSSDTQNVVYWDDELHRYAGFLRARDGNSPDKRVITRTESADFRIFATPRVVIRADAMDPPNVDFYNNAATKYAWASSAYLAFVSVYDHTADTVSVQLAVSRDGTHYIRYRDPAWLPLGPKGSFDSGSIYQAPGVVRQGDKLAVYYAGRDIPHNYPASMIHNAGTVSRAFLRLDGFRSADAGAGTLTTIPLTFTGSHLHINASGHVRAALVAADGTPLPGFSLDDCVPVDGDNTDVELHFRSADLAMLAGTWVRVQFELTAASLYALAFLPE